LTRTRRILAVKPAPAAVWTVGILAAAGAIAYVFWPAGNALRVQVLDVAGYNDQMPAGWMAIRATLGLTNQGRDLVAIRRIHVEPDFAGFNEAYNVGTLELEPPLVVQPGSSLSYQAAVTLLNATQLQPGTHPVVLRVRIEQNGEEVVHEFRAEFDQALKPEQRALRY
jgi:hypothetical protein